MEKANKIYILSILVVVLVAIIEVWVAVNYYKNKQTSEVSYSVAQIDSKANAPYLANIINETQNNTNFRKVLFTGTRSQIVIMSIPVGGEVGAETHTYTEQALFFMSGSGEAILNGKVSPVNPGDVVVVTPGTQHNFINTGTVPLKIYTVYAPPNHIGGLVEATKADADKNTKDEAYGQQPK
jgi:mannose-6-phosphate isomerase-like protein (cupin superfamily)